MKIVVTGATGFVGRPLVRRLTEGGHEVTAWTRDPGRARAALPALCDTAAWEPNAALPPERLRGVDAVVHLAGESVAGGRWTEARKRAIRESRVASSCAIVAAMRELPEAERPRALIAASAIGFYGDRGDEPLSETSAVGAGFLAEVCRDWEDEVGRAASLGVRALSVRVGIVLGRDGGALQSMLPPFRLGLGGRIGSGRQWMSWIHLDDLVALFAFAVENPALCGVVNGVAPQPVTNAEFTAALGRALGRPARLPVPAVALRIALGEMSAMLLASARVLPEATGRSGFTYRYPSLDQALADLCGDAGHELVFEQWVPRPPAEVFPFFSDARNLERITPAFVGFRVLKVDPEPLRQGTRIDYRLALHGVPVRWQSVIDRFEPDRGFADSQVRGPYREWHHVHEFEPARGGTIIRDRIRYALPLGSIGETVGGAFVRRDLERIFAFRRATVAELFGGEAGERNHAA